MFSGANLIPSQVFDSRMQSSVRSRGPMEKAQR